MSSFDVIRSVRKALGIKKIGHSGTLDPEASGLLILALGNATRLLPFVPSQPKEYTFTIQFGKTTDTLDCQGTIIDQGKPVPPEEAITGILPLFKGTISQKPPRYSAIKINGKRAYALARDKKEFELPAREVTIHDLELLRHNCDEGTAFFRARCSKGTYIRSLVRDIAEKAGSIGYATGIRRTAIAHIDTTMAFSARDIDAECIKYVIPADVMFASHQSYCVSGEQIELVSHGNPITIDSLPVAPLIFIYDEHKVLLAVAEHTAGRIYHPKRVFIHA